MAKPIIYYFKSAEGNFGDDFNIDFWSWVFPSTDIQFVGTRDQHDPSTPLICGIGTLLDQFVPQTCSLRIFGSGAGYHSPRPVTDQDRVYFVRGKKTADLIGAPASTALTDPAMLAYTIYPDPQQQPVYETGLIPHFGTKNKRLWRFLCDSLSLRYIDPSLPPSEVAANIRNCKRVVTEAMHGAIFADSLRVPWLPISASKYINTLKWGDWTDGLNLPYAPVTLHIDFEHPAKRLANPFRLYLSAKNLQKALNADAFQLSSSSVFDDKIQQLLQQIEAIRQDYKTP